MTTETQATELAVLRFAVEDFLYREAALLDEWRLDDWLALFTDDATYVVPATDRPGSDPATTLALIDDDRLRLEGRVRRLKSRHAHREYPYSRTRRLVTNVRILAQRDDEVDVSASALVWRFRYGHADSFIGHYLYTLVTAGGDGDFKIRRRRAELDQELLSPNGALSMIF